MARAIWKGSISFGLVQIPVGLYTAEKRDELSFTLLDRHDLAPVGYERVNRRTGARVQWNDVVRGYAYQRGKYVVVTDEDIRNANVRATQTIDILAFVDQSDISPLYYDTPYYLAPTKQGEKAYAILRDTLKQAGKVGVANVVIRTRQHLAALIFEQDMLVLQLLRFSHELRDPSDLDLPKGDAKQAKATAREVEMAKQLVASMVEKWDPSQYHDAYRDDLLARIQRKAKHGEIEDTPESQESTAERGSRVVDLVALLKQSVANQAGGTSRARLQGGPRSANGATKGKASRPSAAPKSRGPKGAPHRVHLSHRPAARKSA